MAASVVFFFLFLVGSLSVSNSARLITIVNKCSYTVWPGILSSGGPSNLSTTGFALQPGRSIALIFPTAWSGSFWGRTLCSEDSTGKFSCVTGDCGSSTVECSGGGAAPPATVAQWKSSGADGLDFYHVNLIGGFNLPMTVEPKNRSGRGNCMTTGCVKDLNEACPNQLKVSLDGDARKSVACNFDRESVKLFSSFCPRTYSEAYSRTKTPTCTSTEYLVTFCPKTIGRNAGNSAKFPRTRAPPPEVPA